MNNGKELRQNWEKEFVCMDQTSENQSDNYTNPKLI
ncbi:DUF7009 family protein [Flagellimonas meridianipacifica]